MSTYTIKRSDGSVIEVDANEFEQERRPTKPRVSQQILAAPRQGFGGPSAKELFHGNR